MTTRGWDRRRAAVAALVAVAVAAAVATLVLAGSPRRHSGGSEVLVPGDPVPAAAPAEVAPACRRWVAPLRATMAEHRYVAEVPLRELQPFLDLANAVDQVCRGADADAVRAEVDGYTARVAPVYRDDTPAVLSRRCTARVAAARRQLRALDPDGPTGVTRELDDAVRAANDALRRCTRAEQLAFTMAEVVPAQRRAGVGVRGADRADRAEPSPLEPEDVKAVTGRAKVSDRCAAALGPARGRLADAVGRSMGAKELDELSRRVAAAASGCTTAELNEFQVREVAPALGTEPMVAVEPTTTAPPGPAGPA